MLFYFYSEIQKQKYYTELRARSKLRAETRQDFSNSLDDLVKNHINGIYGDIFETNLDTNSDSRNRFENSYRFNKYNQFSLLIDNSYDYLQCNKH